MCSYITVTPYERICIASVGEVPQCKYFVSKTACIPKKTCYVRVRVDCFYDGVAMLLSQVMCLLDPTQLCWDYLSQAYDPLHIL